MIRLWILIHIYEETLIFYMSLLSFCVNDCSYGRKSFIKWYKVNAKRNKEKERIQNWKRIERNKRNKRKSFYQLVWAEKSNLHKIFKKYMVRPNTEKPLIFRYNNLPCTEDITDIKNKKTRSKFISSIKDLSELTYPHTDLFFKQMLLLDRRKIFFLPIHIDKCNYPITMN